MLRQAFAASTLTSLLAVLLLTFSGCGSDPDETAPSVGGPKPDRRVETEFRPPNSGEYQRRHIYGPGGTKVETEIEYRDGRVANYYYREDGTLKEVSELHPGGKVMKRRTLYDKDGRTVTFEQVNRTNGSVEKILKRSADGTVNTRTFHADGKTLASEVAKSANGAEHTRTFRADGMLTSELKRAADGTYQSLSYRDNGTLDTEERKLADGSVETKIYWADGVKLRSSAVKKWSKTTTTYYRADGTTVWARFVEDSWWVTEIQVYNSAGKLDHKREYSGRNMTITVYRTDGTVSLKQSYHAQYTYRYNATYILNKVEEYAADGKTLVRELNGSGSAVETATNYKDDGTKTVRQYRSDGTLEKEEFYDSKGTVTKTENHEASENIRDEFAPELFAEPQFHDPSFMRNNGYNPYPYS